MPHRILFRNPSNLVFVRSLSSVEGTFQHKIVCYQFSDLLHQDGDGNVY